MIHPEILHHLAAHIARLVVLGAASQSELRLPRSTRHDFQRQFDLLYRHFGVPAKHEGQLDAILADYHDALGQFPPEVLEHAVREYLGSHDRYFPSIAALRGLCDKQVRTLEPEKRRELSKDDPADEPERCESCGEPWAWWVLQRPDGSLYSRLLVRHAEGHSCTRLNKALGRGTFLGIGVLEDYAHLVAPKAQPEAEAAP